MAISHVRLNIDRHWEDSRRIDQEDQELIQGWLDNNYAQVYCKKTSFKMITA